MCEGINSFSAGTDQALLFLHPTYWSLAIGTFITSSSYATSEPAGSSDPSSQIISFPFFSYLCLLYQLTKSYAETLKCSKSLNLLKPTQAIHLSVSSSSNLSATHPVSRTHAKASAPARTAATNAQLSKGKRVMDEFTTKFSESKWFWRRKDIFINHPLVPLWKRRSDRASLTSASSQHAGEACSPQLLLSCPRKVNRGRVTAFWQTRALHPAARSRLTPRGARRRRLLAALREGRGRRDGAPRSRTGRHSGLRGCKRGPGRPPEAHGRNPRAAARRRPGTDGTASAPPPGRGEARSERARAPAAALLPTATGPARAGQDRAGQGSPVSGQHRRRQSRRGGGQGREPTAAEATDRRDPQDTHSSRGDTARGQRSGHSPSAGGYNGPGGGERQPDSRGQGAERGAEGRGGALQRGPPVCLSAAAAGWPGAARLRHARRRYGRAGPGLAAAGRPLRGPAWVKITAGARLPPAGATTEVEGGVGPAARLGPGDVGRRRAPAARVPAARAAASRAAAVERPRHRGWSNANGREPGRGLESTLVFLSYGASYLCQLTWSGSPDPCPLDSSLGEMFAVTERRHNSGVAAVPAGQVSTARCALSPRHRVRLAKQTHPPPASSGSNSRRGTAGALPAGTAGFAVVFGVRSFSKNYEIAEPHEACVWWSEAGTE